MQVASSDDEPEIVQQSTSIFKIYAMMNKENIDRSNKEFDEIDQETHLISEYISFYINYYLLIYLFLLIILYY